MDPSETTEGPRKAWELPEEHAFRLIYRVRNLSTDDANANIVDEEEDLRRPVDWDAVESRLTSHPEEVKEWIETDRCSKRLFLHQFSSFNFGIIADPMAADPSPILPIDGETSERVMRKVIAAYPDALSLYDGHGTLPVHVLIGRRLEDYFDGHYNLYWTRVTENILHLMYQQCPASFQMFTPGGANSVLLTLLTNSGCGGYDVRRSIFDFLLDVFPGACRIPSNEGEYPLHIAAQHYRSYDAIRKIIHLYPQAAEIKSHAPESYCPPTPLLTTLRRSFGEQNEEHYKILSLLLDSCPWAAAIEDETVVMVNPQAMEPAGDALDYVCVKYCDHVDVDFQGQVPDDTWDEEWGDAEFRKGYVEANGKFITASTHIEHKFGRLWEFLLKVLQTMYGREPFLPLHAAVQGRLCRPWQLVVLHGILKLYPEDATKRDAYRNLPIHSFLESCLVEKERAIRRGFAGDDDDYHDAVKHAFRLILEAYPEATQLSNDSGRFPIHLAIENDRSSCAHEVLVGPILEHAPQTLLKRDVRSNLYPFAAAAVGCEGNLDISFRILRQDPSALALCRRQSTR